MSDEIRESLLKGEAAAELADMASIWADLQLVEMTIHRWQQTVAPKDLYVRRALWEQAVVAYARCFDQSRRRKIPDALVAQMAGKSLQVHEEVLRWRNKLISHRVDDDAAWSLVTLTYRDTDDGPVSVRIRVDLPHGPENDRMAIALGKLARELKNRIWQQWIAPLESKLLTKYAEDQDMKSRAEVFDVQRGQGRFLVTLDPSGRLSS